MGQFVAGETIDPSVNEVISTESRVYAQNGWVTTVRRGPSTTRTTIELDDQGQITRIQESTGNGIGSFLRVTTQSFDESNSRLTERRFRGNGELIRETQFSNFVTIDDVVQDRLYQWEVFFDPSNF